MQAEKELVNSSGQWTLDLGTDSMLQPSGMSSTPMRDLDGGLQEVGGLARVEEARDLGAHVPLRRRPRRRRGRRLVGGGGSSPEMAGLRALAPALARSVRRAAGSGWGALCRGRDVTWSE
jgi:hypothetical protein